MRARLRARTGRASLNAPTAAYHLGGGAIAQLGERVACTDEVAGSNPAGSTDLCRALGGIFQKPPPCSRKTRYDGMEGSVVTSGTGRR